MLKKLVLLVFIVSFASIGVFLIPEVLKWMPFKVHPLFSNPYVDGLIGILVFIIFFYWIIDRVVKWIENGERKLLSRNFSELILATLGMLIGLTIASLISLIFSFMGFPLIRNTLPGILAVVFGYLGFQVGIKKRDEIMNLLPERFQTNKKKVLQNVKLLDTSAIIDGRILSVVECGFIDSQIIVPQGVIDELQLIADSTDGFKRDKGQRGLDILNQLQSVTDIQIHPGIKGMKAVDQLLVSMAKEHHASIITTDYNLNKVCQVQGIKVLNVNDLSEAIKPVVKQGDKFELVIQKSGKEENQGVGYLEDGTMVVVENAKSNINEELLVEVESILQTSSGRIIFTKKVK